MTETSEDVLLTRFQSKLDDDRLARVQMNDALLAYETNALTGDLAEGDGCYVRSTEGHEYYGEVVYATRAGKSCEYGCQRNDQHVHVSIS